MKLTEIETLLPEVFQRTCRPGTPLAALLESLEALHAPAETILAQLGARFDPRRTSEDFVPFLARWVDLDRLFEDRSAPFARAAAPFRLATGLGRLREMVALAAEFSRWRGTAQGLRRFLQTATGESRFEIRENVDLNGSPRLYHLIIVAPGALRPHRELITRIIESEKPAYVTYDLVLREAPSEE